MHTRNMRQVLNKMTLSGHQTARIDSFELQPTSIAVAFACWNFLFISCFFLNGLFLANDFYCQGKTGLHPCRSAIIDELLKWTFDLSQSLFRRSQWLFCVQLPSSVVKNVFNTEMIQIKDVDIQLKLD